MTENVEKSKTKKIDPAADKKAAGSNSFKDKVKNKVKEKVAPKAKEEKNSADGGIEIKTKTKVDFDPEVVTEMFGDDSDFETHQELFEAYLEEIFDDELNEALTTSQRMKRRMIMRRYKSKLKLARRRSMRIRATGDRIQRRARRQAVNNMKRRIAGGRNPTSLSPSEKNRIERMTKKRGAAVSRQTRKLVRDKKQQERVRLQRRNSPK